MATQNSCCEELCIDAKEMIVRKLDYVDAASLSRVCTSWNEAVKTSRVFHRPVLVKIRHRPAAKSTDYFNGIDVFPVENYGDFNLVGSSRNMLLLQDKYTEMLLLDPFSRKSLRFPSPSTLIKAADFDPLKLSGLGMKRIFKVMKAVVVVTSSAEKKTDDEPNPTLAMIYSGYHMGKQYEDKALAYCRAGSWVELDATEQYEDLVPRENRLLLALSTSGSVTTWDFGHSDAKPVKVRSFVPATVLPVMVRTFDLPRSYLVETPEGSLLVRTVSLQPFGYITFDVYTCCLRSGDEWEEIDSIGDEALFLGKSESALVSGRDLPRGCEGNSIYFSNGCQTCIYSLATRKIRKLSGGQYRVGYWDNGSTIWMIKA